MRAVKLQVDRDGPRGQYVLAGSAHFLRTPRLSESLAGRSAIVEVWPFSQGEFDGRFETFVDRVFDDPDSLRQPISSRVDKQEYLTRLCRGGFPEAARTDSVRKRRMWFRTYVGSIAQRDVREMAHLGETRGLVSLLSYLASMTAQELNASTAGSRVEMHRTTVTRYVELLEAVFLVHRLPAWSRNHTSRVVRHAKLHLTDTGLAAALLGVSPESLAIPIAPARGQLVETFVVNELAKQATWSETHVRLHHWRISGGPEVDVVLESDDGRVGIECKAKETVGGEDFRGLSALRDQLGDQFVAGLVLHTGRTGGYSFGDRLTSLPIAALWEV